jgi:hypothetical protein
VGQPYTTPENFQLLFNGLSSPDNPWVVMASLIPWSEFEDKYGINFFIAILRVFVAKILLVFREQGTGN